MTTTVARVQAKDDRLTLAPKAIFGKLEKADREDLAETVREAGLMLCDLFQAIEVLDEFPLEQDNEVALEVFCSLSRRLRRAALDRGLVEPIGGEGGDGMHGRLDPGDRLSAAHYAIDVPGVKRGAA